MFHAVTSVQDLRIGTSSEPGAGGLDRALARVAPTSAVIDRRGRIVRVATGPLATVLQRSAEIGTVLVDLAEPELRAALQDALEAAAATGEGCIRGVPVAAPQTEAVDVSVELIGGSGSAIDFLVVLTTHRPGQTWIRLPESVAASPADADGVVPPAEMAAALLRLRRAGEQLARRDLELVEARATVSALLERSAMPTLLVDRNLRIAGFTSDARSLFNLRADDVGRRLTDLWSRLDHDAIREDVETAYREGGSVERELSTRAGTGATFLVRTALIARADGPGHAAITFVEITDRKRDEDRMRFLAHHDALTLLVNRAGLLASLERDFRSEGCASGCLLLLDLDRFKQVNDVYGHAIGDQLLRMVGRRLTETVGSGDLACRLGGDEFAVVRRRLRHPDDAAGLARRLIASVSMPYEIEGRRVRIGASVGIARRRPEGSEPELLLREADAALYEAKAAGRGSFRDCDPEMRRRRYLRHALEQRLAGALERGEYRVLFQPMVQLSDRRVVGAEALLRWQHPEDGTLLPGAFVPIAEETGLIPPIGAWVLRESCRLACDWPDAIGLSVNISPSQFHGVRLLDDVAAALRGSGLAAGRLTLELTESALVRDDEHTRHTLAELRRIGVRISVDDFGTGYSSLSYLHSFDIDQIKIDRSFVQSLDTRPSTLIVQAVVAIAAGMGVSVCAEGVEDRSQADRLAELGVDDVQGFGLHRPMRAEELRSMWESVPAATAASGDPTP